MKWPTRRPLDPGLIEPPRPEPEVARDRLREARARTPSYRALGAELRRMRETNHFAESIAAAIKGGH